MIDYKISPGTAGNSETPERYDDLPQHDIEVFTSENIQNIYDARRKGKDQVEIEYVLKKLDCTEINQLLELMKDSKGKSFESFLKKSIRNSGSDDIEEQASRVKSALKNKDKWYSLCIIEKNTTGLLGDENGQEGKSNYHALIRQQNKSEKNDISGGTFGKGASVYTYCSGLWFWFAYSVLETPWINKKSKKETKKRFVGRGLVAPYVDYNLNQSIVGPVWFSRPEAEIDLINNYKQQGLPYLNNDADDMAKKFNIPIRSNTECGTTFLIPVFWPSEFDDAEMITQENIVNSLQNEIIKRWFVPIYQNKIKCSIKIQGNPRLTIEINKKYLQTIPELKYKLEILDCYYNKDEKRPDIKIKSLSIKLPKLQKKIARKIEQKFGRKIGTRQVEAKLDLVVKEIGDDEDFKGFTDDDNIGTLNRIALIRNQGMIINHYPYNTKKKDLFNIVGDRKFEAILFIGKTKSENEASIDDHAELFFGFSENAPHNKFINHKNDLHLCKLHRFEKKKPFPENRINKLFENLEKSIYELFPKDDLPPVRDNICDFYKKLFPFPNQGSTNVRRQPFKYSILREGYNKEGKYEWNLILTTNKEENISLLLSTALESKQNKISKPEDFEALGIPEFQFIYDSKTKEKIRKIELKYNEQKGEPIDLELNIMTCKIFNEEIFKNFEPIIEIRIK